MTYEEKKEVNTLDEKLTKLLSYMHFIQIEKLNPDILSEAAEIISNSIFHKHFLNKPKFTAAIPGSWKKGHKRQAINSQTIKQYTNFTINSPEYKQLNELLAHLPREHCNHKEIEGKETFIEIVKEKQFMCAPSNKRTDSTCVAANKSAQIIQLNAELEQLKNGPCKNK